MIGTKIYKSDLDDNKYRELAIWCNANNATIEDKGDYYECVAIPEPTEDEVKAAKIAEIKKRLADTDYQAIKFAEGVLNAEEYAAIKAQREAWRAEINALEV